MMGYAVDLTNLLELTGGDPALERELFDAFTRAGEGFLATLAATTGDETHEQWRKAAHGFKGIAVNLGAEELGRLCKQAQESHTAPPTTKAALLVQLTHAYTEARDYLNGL